jgi:hypothetical protein
VTNEKHLYRIRLVETKGGQTVPTILDSSGSDAFTVKVDVRKLPDDVLNKHKNLIK